MRFGLAGAGCIGQIRARALSQVAGAKLAAVFDVDEGAARGLADRAGAAHSRDFGAMLEREDVDAVLVCSPPPYHEDQVLASLEAGKHVLCEKPLSNNVDACRRMVAAARAADRVLATGFNHRYFPAVQTVKQAIDGGQIGQLDHVRAFAGHVGLSQFRSPWEYDARVVGGGALMDVGIHLIDLTSYLLGDVDEVYGATTNRVWNLEGAEDNGFALLRSSAGRYATLQASWSEWKGYRFHLDAYGDRGVARAYYAPMFSSVIRLEKPGGRPRRSVKLYPKTIVQEKLRGWEWTVERTFRQELNDFCDRCAGNADGALADGFAGLRAVEIANAVYRCTELREPIRLSRPS